MNKQSWIKSDGKFQCRSIRQVEDYIKHMSGIEVSVTRTRKSIFITYMTETKPFNYYYIYMKSGIHSLVESDFADLFASLPAYCPKDS